MKSNDLMTKNLNRPDGAFNPLRISISKLCSILNISEYTGQIQNRICRVVDDHFDVAAEHVYLDKYNDPLIDDTAIFLFAEIFTGYTSQDDVIEVWKWLKDVNGLRRAQYNINLSISSMSKPQLREFLRGLRKVDKSKATDMVKTTAKKAYRQKIFQRIAL